jgi:hypothetical protein
MPGIMEKVAGVFGGRTAKPGDSAKRAAPTGATPAATAPAAGKVPAAKVPGAAAAAVPGGKKPFDIKLYMKAVSMFFNDFFKKKLPYFFKNIGPVLKGASAWFSTLPGDEKAAYGVLVFGHLFLLLGIVFFIV